MEIGDVVRVYKEPGKKYIIYAVVDNQHRGDHNGYYVVNFRDENDIYYTGACNLTPARKTKATVIKSDIMNNISPPTCLPISGCGSEMNA